MNGLHSKKPRCVIQACPVHAVYPYLVKNFEHGQLIFVKDEELVRKNNGVIGVRDSVYKKFLNDVRSTAYSQGLPRTEFVSTQQFRRGIVWELQDDNQNLMQILEAGQWSSQQFKNYTNQDRLVKKMLFVKAMDLKKAGGDSDSDDVD